MSGVLVDTTVWSEFFRRKRGSGNPRIRSNLADLIDSQRVRMIGPIRQEILSGIKDQKAFDELRASLRAFADEALVVKDYERAAEFFNRCRKKGIQGSFIDYLICSAAVGAGLEIYTLDKDFPLYARALPIKLYKAAR